jgi:hypothetical protein
MPMMRRILPVIVGLSLLVAACDQAPSGSLRGPGPPPNQGETGGGGGQGGPQGRSPLPIRDGGVIFDVYSFVCGATLGTEEKALRPDGYFCDVGISVLNRDPKAIRLDPYAQFLIAGGRRVTAWKKAMDELVLHHPDNLFVQPIPPGGGATGTLIFDIPEGVQPERLELHAGPGTRGTSVSVEGCSLYKAVELKPCALERRGGGQGVAYPVRAELSVAYPISFRFGEGTNLCFDRREWILRRGQNAKLNRLDGQGVIILTSEKAAEFQDNTGVRLKLVASKANDRDAAVCG